VVRSGAHRREDEKIKSNQETQALMAQKTKIVIEEENDTPPQDNPAAPPDPASAADEPAPDPDPIKDLEGKTGCGAGGCRRKS
jgi:hypothetical protein